MNQTYPLRWDCFENSYTYCYDLSGIHLDFKAPYSEDRLEGFELSVHDLEQAIATTDEIHGPVRLMDCSWCCECEDDEAVYVQGSIVTDVMVFHSADFARGQEGKLRSDTDLLLAVINAFNKGENSKYAGDRLEPRSEKDFVAHEINGRVWHESLAGYLSGTQRYNVFTRVTEDISIAVYFELIGFWPNDKLPDPAHKAEVFKSALDFLNHINIVLPQDKSQHPDLPPIGLHSPVRDEKDISGWGDEGGGSDWASNGVDDDSGW